MAVAVVGAPEAARGAMDDGATGSMAAGVLAWLHRTNTTAIRGAELAQQKSTSGTVRRLAAQLVGDHTVVEREVGALAAAHGVQLPVEGGDGLADLEDLHSDEFDAAFLRWVAGRQREDASEARSVQARAQQAREPALAALLGRLAPRLDAHASSASDAERSVAARTASSVAAGSPR
jgi:predicted outer membrane protein